MPLDQAQQNELKQDLNAHKNHMAQAVGKAFRGLHSILNADNIERALMNLSNRNTSGLNYLFSVGREDLSVERFLIDSGWADSLDPMIKRQCQKNLGLPVTE